MARQKPTASDWRQSRFEMLEERLALCALPVIDVAPHGELALDVQLETVAPQLDTVHGSTGVSSAHNTYGLHGAGQTVAVIDSGIAYDHVNLGGGFGANYRVVGGWDFAENDANPFDDAPAGFHGTHVAGIIGSDHATNTGVAPDADLVALRVFNDAGSGNFVWVEQALQWVITHVESFENPITTVNMSLGVPDMNYAGVPNWAMLEDELQMLHGLGIFVAVSAGNDFQEFSARGLSYPAVSQWVVPVASANDTGTAISGFSQRDHHVLVAPGETITSTVPDALFSFNGVPNDWATASGTSMASPYVAGASVLVREALELSGATNINQDMIYDILFDTSSLIYDSITASSYHFIDVEAAIASIMDDGDAGSDNNGNNGSNSSETDWGQVERQQHDNIDVAGEQWYEVTLKRTGMLTVQSQFATGSVQLQVYSDSQQLLASGDEAAGSTRVDAFGQAGETLWLRVTGNAADADFTLSNIFGISGQTATFHGTSGNDQIVFTRGGNNSVSVNGLEYSFAANAFARIDIQAGSGRDAVTLTGSAAAETATIKFDALTLAGGGLTVNAFDAEQGQVNSGGGKDVATFYDSAGNDQFQATKLQASMTGGGNQFAASGFASVTAHATAGGNDAATLTKPADKSKLKDKGGTATLSGSGFQVVARGFEQLNGAAASAVKSAGKSHGAKSLAFEQAAHANLDSRTFAAAPQGDKVNERRQAGCNLAPIFAEQPNSVLLAPSPAILEAGMCDTSSVATGSWSAVKLQCEFDEEVAAVDHLFANL
jgi:hypothetical protein